METRLVIVRHGETEWNRKGKYQGHLDSPLSGRGIDQAASVARGLTGFKFNSFYSSDLGRARQTAEIISSQIDMDYLCDSSLRERNYGIFHTLTKEEIRERYPADARLLESGDPDFRIPQGESRKEFHERCNNALEQISLENAGGNVLVVTHGGVLVSIFMKTLNLPWHEKRRYFIPNAAINIFNFSPDSGWFLESWGDTGHMRRESLESRDDL